MKKLVVITGAGMSQESGLKTFRENNGLWENHDVMEVASPQGWAANPKLVLNFYNERRKQLFESSPNKGHQILADLEKYFQVKVITQNIDDFHEQAGSTSVLHLHGELKKARSTKNPELIYTLKNWQLNLGDKCELGSQLRPHIVWFGEEVPALYDAMKITEKADLLLIIGTSLSVYPAAGLINYAPPKVPIYYIDPNPAMVPPNVTVIKAKSSLGLQQFIKLLKIE